MRTKNVARQALILATMTPEEGLIATIEARREAWTVPQLASLLSMSRSEIYEQVKAGKLPAIRIASNIRLCPKMTGQWLRLRMTV
jgi:predicted DNA-binding transcriptional regulator AlpA